MSRIRDIDTYLFGAGDRLLFDANVWLYIYRVNDPTDHRSEVYSRAFHRVRKAKSKVFIDAVIASEIINRMARLEHRRAQETDRTVTDFKQFRGNPAFRQIAEGIAADARRILSQCERCDSGFPELDVAKVLTAYEQGGNDFNDLLVSELCRKESFLFVTHDQDFAATDATVLTANRALLRT